MLVPMANPFWSKDLQEKIELQAARPGDLPVLPDKSSSEELRSASGQSMDQEEQPLEDGESEEDQRPALGGRYEEETCGAAACNQCRDG